MSGGQALLRQNGRGQEVFLIDGYSSLAYFYDALTENVEYARRAKYLSSLLAENGCTGGILLDLACGTGSLSVFFREMGYDLICADISPDMLTIARQKLPDTLLLCQDMRELDLYGTIDGAVCSLDALNHLENLDDFKKAVSRVSLFMNPGGVFVFDVNTIYKHREILKNNTFVYDLPEVYCVWANESQGNRVNFRLDIFARDNESGLYSRFAEEFSENAWRLDEISEILDAVGFKITGIYDDMTKNPPTEKSERVYFVCVKNN